MNQFESGFHHKPESCYTHRFYDEMALIDLHFYLFIFFVLSHSVVSANARSCFQEKSPDKPSVH